MLFKMLQSEHLTGAKQLLSLFLQKRVFTREILQHFVAHRNCIRGGSFQKTWFIVLNSNFYSNNFESDKQKYFHSKHKLHEVLVPLLIRKIGCLASPTSCWWKYDAKWIARLQTLWRWIYLNDCETTNFCFLNCYGVSSNRNERKLTILPWCLLTVRYVVKTKFILHFDTSVTSFIISLVVCSNVCSISLG